MNISNEIDRARFLGCLVGGAVGDALGAPVEFMQYAEIAHRFGHVGITSYVPAYGRIGAITDDTQMMLFTAEGLIRTWVRGCYKGVADPIPVVAHAYLRWLRTQGGQPLLNQTFVSDESGWLIKQPELHQRRAPGNTCLAALRAMKNLGEPARNGSKGCGAVMRMAPVGLYCYRAGDAAFELGCELGALTHGHPTGYIAAGAFAQLIFELCRGISLKEALASTITFLKEVPNHQETLYSLQRAQDLAAIGYPSVQAISKIGQGWVAEEALAIGVYCALVSRSFREGVLLAVNHDGDSDSTAAIAGNLLGVMMGIAEIPTELLEPLELKETILEIARHLYEFRDWSIELYPADVEFDNWLRDTYPSY